MIMGCGDIGRRVALLYQNDAQHSIACTGWARSYDTIEKAQQLGIEMGFIDLDSGLPLDAQVFQDVQLFWFAPPPPAGGLDNRLRTFLSQVQGAPSRIVLISTTGVYGDCQGEWVDENTPVNPSADRAKRRADAEISLQAWAKRFKKEWVILRVPGIYAQERLPLARLERGEPVLKAELAPWTNRIHADDLAMIAKVAMEKAASGSIYNACDGHPSTMTEYFNTVADYAGLPRPPQVDQQTAQTSMSKGMLSYLSESRRIRNDKLLAELGIELQYPDLKSALTTT